MTDPKDDALEIVGTTIEGKYKIESVVGEGGFALVYKAMHLVWKRPVAIKAFRALADLEESQRATLVEEFIREGALLAELSERSAAIVQARDVGTLTTKKGEHVPYMILEWLDGSTLESVLHDELGRGVSLRSLSEAVALLNPVAEALALAHKRGIAHRDVKPANIFVMGEARGECALKLLDFGIAKVVADAQKMSGAFSKTGGHVTSFTPAYGAPEQFSRTHGSTGPWTDVFSFALVVTEVLCGKAPLDGDTFVQLGFCSADHRRRPTPRNLGAVVPDAVEAIFAKAVAVSPEERYQTAGDFWNALREALSMAPIRAPQDLSSGKLPAATDTNPLGATALAPSTSTPMVASPSSTVTAQPPSARPWLPFVLVGVGAVAGLGGYFAFGRSKGSPTTVASSSPSVSPSVSAAMPPNPAGSCGGDTVLVPAGSFYMGTDHPPADKKYLENEMPAHPIMLTPYCMDRFEVTVERYRACANNGNCLRADKENQVPGLSVIQHKAYDPLCNMNQPEAHAKHPINCVDYEQADKFCKVQHGRLPTEAEWEFAARGPDGRSYPWGDDAPSSTTGNACGAECLAWAKENKVEADFPGSMYSTDDHWVATAPVGSFPAGKSRYGIEDVVGNVWEWTADYYAPYGSDTHTTQDDPKGPATGTERVIRGGAWNATFPEWARPTFRFKAAPSQRSHGIGFRCVYPPKT